MFRVIYENQNCEIRHKDFEEVEDAIDYAEKKYKFGWLLVRVIDEYENTIATFKN